VEEREREKEKKRKRETERERERQRDNFKKTLIICKLFVIKYIIKYLKYFVINTFCVASAIYGTYFYVTDEKCVKIYLKQLL